MKAKVEVDLDDVISGMNETDITDLAKNLVKEKFDVEDMVQIVKEMGYTDNDILNCLEWDEVRDFVIAND